MLKDAKDLKGKVAVLQGDATTGYTLIIPTDSASSAGNLGDYLDVSKDAVYKSLATELASISIDDCSKAPVDKTVTFQANPVDVKTNVDVKVTVRAATAKEALEADVAAVKAALAKYTTMEGALAIKDKTAGWTAIAKEITDSIKEAGTFNTTNIKWGSLVSTIEDEVPTVKHAGTDWSGFEAGGNYNRQVTVTFVMADKADDQRTVNPVTITETIWINFSKAAE